jgi:hypothetical protein
MCTVSNVGDFYGSKWLQDYPWTMPTTVTVIPVEVTRAEFDALRAEVEECKELVLAAKRIDAALGEPNCEMDEKVALLKRVAELVGIDMSELFQPNEVN